MKKLLLAAVAAGAAVSACTGGRVDEPGLSLSPRAGELCMAEGDSLTIAEWSGTAGIPGDSVDEPFVVPAGCSYDALIVRVEWDLVVEDLDLEVLDGSAAVVASSGAFNLQDGVAAEQATIADPKAGDYIARVNNFAGVMTPFTGTAVLECTTAGGCVAGAADDDGGSDEPVVAGPTLPADTRVVVAVIDSAINAYHDFYYAGSPIYADAAPSAVTPSVLQELGVKPENVLELTRTGDLQADVAADQALWGSLQRGEAYWVKGTNVVMVSFVAGELPVLVPDINKSAHGIGTSAAVLTANPEAVILFVETEGDLANDASHDYAFLHPAVDILSTSYGVSIPGTGFPLPEWRAFRNSYPAVVEMGKLHFSSGGNGPGLTPLRAGAGPWWSIGVSGIEEGDSEGRTLLSGKFPDFLSDFYQDLPYCHDAENCYQGVGGTSFSTPRAAGVASRVLLEARRASGHKGGISTLAGTPVMVERELPVSNWFLRRALEQAAYVPDILNYDPAAGVTDLVGVPVNPAAPWLQIGWGDLTAMPEKGVVSAALSHLGFDGEARAKSTGFCEFQTEIIQERKIYWDNIAASLPDLISGGDVPPPPLDEDPFIYCASLLPTHPASNDPGGN